MQKRYILALDQGTTSSRAAIYDIETKRIICIRNKQLSQHYPIPGWVEHDPEEIWEGQLEALKSAVDDSGISPHQIACIGITNQRETVIVWDKLTGKPVYNAVVWQCRRTAQMCNELKSRNLKDLIHDKTGLVIDAYFSGTKIKWILENVPGAKEKAEKGELLAGTVDTWLIWRLTGGESHITDCSNASRTMLFNIKSLEWDDGLLKELEIPRCILPEVVSSSGMAAMTSREILGIRIPITGIAGDQQAALFGQVCFSPGSAKNTYGTGCFILMNTGSEPVISKNNLITTIAWSLNGRVEYALEGSIFNAGSAIQWLRDELKLIESASQSEAEAETVPDTGGVYVVPAFTGLGAPYWDMYARGTIVGITRGTSREHIIRATLEAIAYQTRDIIEDMQLDSGINLKELKADGGASLNNFLMQFQADMLNVQVERPKCFETTALGAVYLAGLGAGVWESRSDIINDWEIDRIYTPKMVAELSNSKYEGWKRAVGRSAGWEAQRT